MSDMKKTELQKGYSLLLGAHQVPGGYCFAVEASKDANVSLLLYRNGEKIPSMEIPFEKECREGRVFYLSLPKFRMKGYEYNFLINGKVVQDPCAYHIVGKSEFGKVDEEEDFHKIRCGFLKNSTYDWENLERVECAYSDMILYKVHVRGYTKKARINSRKRGTFAGLKEMIPYWKELGINAIELMPAYEFSEIETVNRNEKLVKNKVNPSKVNYWGYTDAFYFAPKTAFCATKDPEKEFKDLIKALHREGIACIMEFYFPETVNPMISLRALQFWKSYYHVDGFHLMGAGVPMNMIMQDGTLADVKLMADGFDQRYLSLFSKGKEKTLALYQNGFQTVMRRLLKSDEDMAVQASNCIRANLPEQSYVNYMTSQNGFTLYDLVSYNEKHNEENGEGNRDGENYNYSWNCGEEGPSRKKAIQAVRLLQMKNAVLMMLLSQGVPMIYGGDEISNSQKGNNNAYCQDNEIGWIDWKNARKSEVLRRFVQETIAFRKKHPILHTDMPMMGTDLKAEGFPDISVHGDRAWYCPEEHSSRLLGMMYNGAYAMCSDGQKDQPIYVGYNFHWDTKELALPNLNKKMTWVKVADTGEERKENFFYEHEEIYTKSVKVSPRTIVVLVGK